MSQHIDAWLDAYLDEELDERYHAKVQEHLAGCPACQHLLAERQSLSQLLAQIPAATGNKSAAQFASEVNLLLPREQKKIAQRSSLLWILTPVGLLLVIIGLQIYGLMNNIFQWVPGAEQLLQSAAPQPLLSLAAFPWAQSALDATMLWSGVYGLFNWNIITQISTLLAVGFLYLAWLLCWWLYNRPHSLEWRN